MSLILPLPIEGLFRKASIESERVEFKATWDAETTSYQVLKSICAFANDLHNLNGGYIILGVEEGPGGRALRPVRGLSSEEVEAAQKWLRGHCKRMDPIYQPIFSPESVDGKLLLVIWVPGSEVRPHSAPSGKKEPRRYFVRIGSETVDAEKSGLLQDLMRMTASVPFDDRRATAARIEDMREIKVREFLRDIESGLLGEEDTLDIYQKLRLVAPANGHDVPKNIGLLMFSRESSEWFRGAKIEVVQFPGDLSGDVIEERVFRGGIHEQLKEAVAYLETLSSRITVKQPHTSRAKSWVSYPIQAFREALVNAVYHRGYEADQVEPIKVYLYPDRLEVISYPGPLPGINMEHLDEPRKPMPQVPTRNRRVGDFLKDLRLAEGRGTGLPKLYSVMRSNGSPPPRFDFDEARTYFRVTLPVHPELPSWGGRGEI
ncbi:MAG: putative DNA binding domain-containing protein [Magnetococcales bacterium]|nr:putative DNA binding domain-containing protein [Magnetococcales bacterium]